MSDWVWGTALGLIMVLLMVGRFRTALKESERESSQPKKGQKKS